MDNIQALMDYKTYFAVMATKENPKILFFIRILATEVIARTRTEILRFKKSLSFTV